MELKCDMRSECVEDVTHLDESGWTYCTAHAAMRRGWKRVRKLRPAELRKLHEGKQLERY